MRETRYDRDYEHDVVDILKNILHIDLHTNDTIPNHMMTDSLSLQNQRTNSVFMNRTNSLSMNRANSVAMNDGTPVPLRQRTDSTYSSLMHR